MYFICFDKFIKNGYNCTEEVVRSKYFFGWWVTQPSRVGDIKNILRSVQLQDTFCSLSPIKYFFSKASVNL